MALSVATPAESPLRVNDPVLWPAAIVSTEGDILTFGEELASDTFTPPFPAGRPRVILPLTVLPTLTEEPGRETVIPAAVTLKRVLVEDARPGLAADRV